MDDVENSKFEKYVQKDWDGNMTGKMSYILNRKLLNLNDIHIELLLMVDVMALPFFEN